MKRKGILCFLKKDKQVLLAQIDYGSGTVVWNGISGFIESDEKAEDALLREVKEEIGIEIDKDSLEHRGSHEISNELELEIFLAYKWYGNPEPREESIKQLRWFDIDRLPFEEMFAGNDEWVMRKII